MGEIGFQMINRVLAIEFGILCIKIALSGNLDSPVQ
jgi:hypothetical protein